MIEKAIADKAFPGATLAVGYKDNVALHAFGKLSYDAKSPQVKLRTMYDVASLTKVIVTTTLVEKLVEGDFPSPLQLDAPIERYLPEWASGPQPEWRRKVTVRHLMTHTSGLPPFKEYWRTSKGKADTLRMIFAEPLESEPGTKMVYSDLGIILMAEIIERLTGRTLDDLAKEYIFAPLGMNDSMYKPPKKLWPSIAPTEFDANYPPAADSRRSARRKRVCDWRRFRARGSFQHRAGFGGVLPDASERRRVCAPEDFAPRDDCAVHRAARAFRRHADAWLGGADRRQLERTLLFGAQFRAHRFHWHFDLDRSGPASFCGSADQSREPDAGKSQDRRGAASVARCGDAGAGIGDGCAFSEVA